MAAALLEAHGVRTGAYLSPHLTTLRRAHPDRRRRPRARRLRRRGRARRRGGRQGRPHAGGRRARDAVRAAHRRGVRRARRAAASRSRWSRPASAAATTPPTCSRAPVAVLTNVGLEHTRWLGPTIADIAREKLAVVAPGRDAGARRARPRGRGGGGAGRRARIVRAEPADGAPLHRLPAHELRRRARRGRERCSGTLDEAAVAPRRVRAHACPGRFQVVAERAADDLRRRAQPVRRRGARRGAARRGGRAAARRGAVRARRQGRRGRCCARCVPLASGAVFTASPQPARAAARHARLAVEPAAAARRPRSSATRARAVERAQELAGRGRRRGGHRLDLPGRRPAVRARAPEGVGAVNDRAAPSVLQMVALVAVVVALVILVFFALGYALRPDVPVSPSGYAVPAAHADPRRLRHQQRRAQHGGQRPDPRAASSSGWR